MRTSIRPCEGVAVARVTITVHLEPGEPVSGWFEGPAVPSTPFSGLLELVALIDRVRPRGDAGEDRQAS
jgi:hypothetical protein